MHNIPGVMWNVAFGYSIVWTGSRSSSSTLSFVCGVDGHVPMFLSVVCTSLVFLRNCHMSAISS
jgi:hypothetical protein